MRRLRKRSDRISGTVTSVNIERGFAFLDSRGVEYFAHVTQLEGGVTLEELRVGEVVSFVAGMGPKGPRAVGVRRAGPGAEPGREP